MSHTNLEVYYRRMFALVQYHKWNPEWLENILPWEFDAYVEMLKMHLEEEKVKQQQQQQSQNRV